MIDTAKNENIDKKKQKISSSITNKRISKPSSSNNIKLEDFFSSKISQSITDSNSSLVKDNLHIPSKKEIIKINEGLHNNFLGKKREEKSIINYSLLLSNQNISKSKSNYNYCSICREGGELLCCDHCPRSFHLFCLNISQNQIPEGDWFCPKCMKKILKRNNLNRRIHKKKINHITEPIISKLKSLKVIRDIGKENDNKYKYKENSGINKNKCINNNNPLDGKKDTNFPINLCSLQHNSQNHSMKPNIDKLIGLELFSGKNIASEYQTKIIYIYDFLYSFSQYIQLDMKFSLDKLIDSLSNPYTNNIIDSILISLAYIFVSDIKMYSYSEIKLHYPHDIFILIKLISENTNTRSFIEHTISEIIYHVLVLNKNQEFSMKIKKFDNNEFIFNFSFNEKIDLITLLIDYSYETQLFREVLEFKLYHKNYTREMANSLEKELQTIESRQEEILNSDITKQTQAHIDKINIQLNKLKSNCKMGRRETIKKKKELEQKREKIKSSIKEMETLEHKKEEINEKLAKIGRNLGNIDFLNDMSQYLGKDSEGKKYYIFSWDKSRIFLKIKTISNKTQWNYFYYEEKTKFNFIIDTLNDNNTLERELKNRIINKIQKNIFIEKKTDNNNDIEQDSEETKSVIDEFEDISDRLNSLDKKFTSVLINEHNVIWESPEIRNKLKKYIKIKKTLDEYKKYIEIFFTNINKPYINNFTQNDNDIESYFDKENFNEKDFKCFLIRPNIGLITVKAINQKLKKSKEKTKLFTKEQKELNIYKKFKHYLSNKFSNFSQLYLGVFFLEAIYNQLIMKNNNAKHQNINKKRENNERISKNDSIIKWNDYCMVCGEYGNLICCEKCPNVIHVYCASLSYNPDFWFCKECLQKINLN